MIARARAFVRAHWPALRLRTILLSVLMFAAILPGLSAIFLRVYENTLVRQTEAELIAQTAVLSAVAEADWPGAPQVPFDPARRRVPGYYRPEPATIDLGSDPVLPARPATVMPSRPPDPAAVAVAARLGPVIEETSRTTLASIIVLDRNGTVVRGFGEGGNWRDLEEVRAALSGQPHTVLRRNDSYHPRYSMEWLSRASALRIHHARPVVVNSRVEGVILTSRSPRALFRGIYQDRIKIALGIVGTLGLIGFLAVLVSRGIARPIEALSRAARDVATGGGGEVPPAPATAAVEIRDLYEDFGRMARAVDRRSRYLRDFAAAVSHEFKTPLAGIQGAVELLQDHDDMEPDQRRRFLANIAADGRRLASLVTRLLDLARADMARPEAGLSVDVGPPMMRAVDARADRLTILNRLDAHEPRVAVPASTLEMVLSTLLENSLQAGATTVTIEARPTADAWVLTVTDDGPGLAPADARRIFEPFFTTRRGEGGAGLGLSIARALLAANGATLDLVPSDAGAVFELVLPLAARIQPDQVMPR
ncbi:HAMP domain-containing sensor histidine kinase [Brevundimonas sp.]|uniref:sensor histidine kinase n=1 Tax=Brevundimonas sp. TaxID=1871086 RepID=UPI002487CE5C|nr:HAMP domain-containing sensor histidine kinase [Brevundimonas sp.]MDI1280135.1 HAMP domain-containing sensor histidine kinase [Brevundimonas sp.]